METGTMLRGMHHAAIICADYERSRRFYVEVLGLRVIAETYREARRSHKLDLALPDGTQIELFSFPDPPARPSYPEARGLRHLAFVVDDVAGLQVGAGGAGHRGGADPRGRAHRQALRVLRRPGRLAAGAVRALRLVSAQRGSAAELLERGLQAGDAAHALVVDEDLRHLAHGRAALLVEGEALSLVVDQDLLEGHAARLEQHLRRVALRAGGLGVDDDLEFHGREFNVDALITAAARFLAAGDALGALQRVALREDPPALALRGIAMAQLGEHARARELLREAVKAFGPREAVSRARCVVAEAEVALAMRDFADPPRALRQAAEVRTPTMTASTRCRRGSSRCGGWSCWAPGRGDTGAADGGSVGLSALACGARGFGGSGAGAARAAHPRARLALIQALAAARHAGVAALIAETEQLHALLDRPAARRIDAGVEQPLRLGEVEDLLASPTLVIDACRRAIRDPSRAIAGRARPTARADRAGRQHRCDLARLRAARRRGADGHHARAAHRRRAGGAASAARGRRGVVDLGAGARDGCEPADRAASLGGTGGGRTRARDRTGASEALAGAADDGRAVGNHDDLVTPGFGAGWIDCPSCDGLLPSSSTIPRRKETTMSTSQSVSPASHAASASGSTSQNTACDPHQGAELKPSTGLPVARAAEVVREYGPYPGAPAVHGVSHDGDRIWAATALGLLAIDPPSGEVVRTLPCVADAGTAFDGRHLYQIAESRINKIDPATGRVIASIPAPSDSGHGSSGLTWAEGSLWVGQYRDRKIVQIDPETGDVRRTIESNRFVTGVTWVDGSSGTPPGRATRASCAASTRRMARCWNGSACPPTWASAVWSRTAPGCSIAVGDRRASCAR
ncbi:glyoxalase/Bleomycin resistance protein/Dioxygenase superfamily domain-containing protein [Ditylenchus destructor]|nr:glyoxalase/Bleomycin resistance protein/Dioxygenase superfamily domain-containing protein [Ditylenchus destructor]